MDDGKRGKGIFHLQKDQKILGVIGDYAAILEALGGPVLAVRA